MKTINQFIKENWQIVAIFALIIVVVAIANTCGDSEISGPVIIYKQNPELQKINSELKNQIFESESKILILETKIENLEKNKKSTVLELGK